MRRARRNPSSFEDAQAIVEEIAMSTDGGFTVTDGDLEIVRDLVLEHGAGDVMRGLAVANIPLIVTPTVKVGMSPAARRRGHAPPNVSKAEWEAWFKKKMIPMGSWTKEQWGNAIRSGLWWTRSRAQEIAAYRKHAAQEGRDWGPDGEEAFLNETMVRDALLQVGGSEVRSTLTELPLSVRSTYSPTGKAIDHIKATPRAVYVFSDGLPHLDPYGYREVGPMFDEAVAVLREDGRDWSWESYDTAVQYFMVRPKENAMPVARGPSQPPRSGRRNPACTGKTNPPFDDWRKTMRSYGGLVRGRIDCRDSSDDELELFVMNEEELYRAVTETGRAADVKAVVDQFFLYTPVQFEQLMEAVAARKADQGEWHDNPRFNPAGGSAPPHRGWRAVSLAPPGTHPQMPQAWCRFCGTAMWNDDGVGWVDASDGDVCDGDIDGVNENELHVPVSWSESPKTGWRPEFTGNPSDNPRELAVSKFKEFWRQEPTKIGEFPASFKIPRRVRKLGHMIHVLYESKKTDPETLKKPGQPLAYIHESKADVFDVQGERDTAVPDFIANAEALVCLGNCLGFKWRDQEGGEHEAEGTDPLPQLWCTPDGHALLVIQSRREVLQIMWGDGLKVEARGIVG